mmetsp:Transcript_12613/g.18876  ORF Transcript_12613/g.18876 Transcript_12613/m.18876 type:complete len:177 (+) Transcript_12613:116-646(+)
MPSSYSTPPPLHENIHSFINPKPVHNNNQRRRSRKRPRQQRQSSQSLQQHLDVISEPHEEKHVMRHRARIHRQYIDGNDNSAIPYPFNATLSNNIVGGGNDRSFDLSSYNVTTQIKQQKTNPRLSLQITDLSIKLCVEQSESTAWNVEGMLSDVQKGVEFVISKLWLRNQKWICSL